MPGRLFSFNKDDNNNNNSSSRRNRRRKMSLLGRKNQSENDLQRQGEAVVLPENLKTVLLAGTPECWSLSTNQANVVLPTQSDADLLSFASSSVDLDSPTSQASSGSDGGTGSRQSQPRQTQQQQQVEGGFWPRLYRKSAFSSISRRNSEVGSIAEEQQQQQEPDQDQAPPKDPSSMVVVCPSPIPQPPPVQDALNMWLNSVDALLNSRELFTFVNSTRDVVLTVGGMAVKTAFLPVTIPLHWAAMTKDFVGHACQQVLRTARHKQVANDQIPKLVDADQLKEEKEVAKDNNNPLVGALQLVPFVLGTAGKIKDEIGAVVVSLVTPPQPSSQQQQSVNNRNDNQAALDRLRLPVFTEEGQEQPPSMPAPQPLKPASKRRLTRADFTKYLMRVEDVGVAAPGTRNATVLYIDLSDEYGDRELLEQVLDRLATRGIELTSSHAPTISPSEQTSATDIEWKPEGTTAKLLRKRARQTPERWEETLQNDVLIWSGTFKQQRAGSAIHGQYPLFLARGIVPNLSPRAFLELFWNDKRTHEYNFYCMGRETVLSIDDELLSSSSSSSNKKAHAATKVVKSDTRVPFTSLSVTLLTLMHCRPLPGGPKEGYVIVSRSLVSGMAGYHTTLDKNTVQKSQSEILWGVNVLRPVPNHPEQTELTSLSQVASAMVPKFLSHRIGLMGVEDFFRNIRSPNDSKAACSYDSTGCESFDSTTVQA